uniref:Uncharacterized protein n=1 Tax=Arundo donax TaxID=35708 RepID=A0A0A9GAV8_ARUDO
MVEPSLLVSQGFAEVPPIYSCFKSAQQYLQHSKLVAPVPTIGPSFVLFWYLHIWSRHTVCILWILLFRTFCKGIYTGS